MEFVTAPPPDVWFQSTAVQFSHRFECDWYSKLCLVKIGDVVHETEHLAGVNKTEGGRIATGHDRRVAKAVETTVRGGESAIDGISTCPVFTLVRPAAPWNPSCPTRVSVSL